jgi:anaerobic magnesium-protoporphyrin IX monomethyl ester cyclase
MTKVLILNLPGPVVKSGSRWFNTTKSGEASLRYYPYPWFMGYATALLKENGYDAVFKDAVAMEWSIEKTHNFINEFAPDYIVCEPTPVGIEEDRDFLKSLDPKIKKIAVGNLATNFPHDCLEFTDYAVVGEYEFSLLEFLDSEGKNLPSCFVSKGKKTFERAPLVELDKFPFPERDDTPIEYYNEPSCYGKNVVMISSRGCRLRCSYCIIEDVYGKHVYRTRSAKSVVDEIEYLQKNYNFDEIYFDDDNMVSKKDHIVGICKEIVDRGVKANWLCMGDGLLDDETLEWLAKAGCVTYKWGLEHLDPEVLKQIPKPLKGKRQLELIKKCRELGMRSYTNLIVGLPGSTKEKDLDMLNQVINARPDLLQIAIATPIRGTKFYRDAIKNGWLKKSKNKFDVTGESVVSYPDYTSEEITEVFHSGWKMWYRHVYLKQPSTLWFFFSSEVRRNGLWSTIKKALAYFLKSLSK